MGVNNFQYGDDLACFIKLQSSFGTAVVPAATDAFRAVECTMGQPIERVPVNDRRKTRSAMETVKGRTPLQPWSTSVILRPSGSLGVAPDFSDLLKLTFGTETVVASTSVAYSFLEDMTGLYATIFRDLTDVQEGVYDAIVQTCELRVTPDGLVLLSFSGVGSNFIEASRSAANGSGSGSTSLVVDDADFFTKYAVIQNVTQSDDNSGAGYQITDIDYDTDTLTISPAASWANDDVWAAFLPTGSYTGDPLYGNDGTFSLDSGSSYVNYLGAGVTINTGLDLHNRENDSDGSPQATDVILSGQRSVSGSTDFMVKRSEMYLASEARRKVSQDLQMVLGTTAAKRLQVDANNIELDPGQRTSPETGPIEVSYGFTALGTSGEDEMTWTFN